MGWVVWCIADYYNPNGYLFNHATANGGNTKAVAITSSRNPVKIVVHKRWHTLKQFNPWRVQPVSRVLLK